MDDPAGTSAGALGPPSFDQLRLPDAVDGSLGRGLIVNELGPPGPRHRTGHSRIDNRCGSMRWGRQGSAVRTDDSGLDSIDQ